MRFAETLVFLPSLMVQPRAAAPETCNADKVALQLTWQASPHTGGRHQGCWCCSTSGEQAASPTGDYDVVARALLVLWK